MDKNISKSFVNTPLTLLLIILVILIIYCVMKHKLYSLQSIRFDDTSDTISFKINEYIIILNNVIEKSKIKLKENFGEEDNLANDLANLQLLSSNINNLNSINLQNINTQRLINKDIIMKLLNDIYILKYIESINQGNAVYYNEYNKYISPKQNIFYKQYL